MRAGVPVVPGTEQPLDESVSDAEVQQIAERIGYPLMLKAVAGGGGKGMRMVASPDELPGALRAARSEAGSAFGDSAVYLERRIMQPRHIEVQLLGDHHGTVVPFVERECSLQRRHQKVIEESPSLAISTATRRAITSAAAAVARSVELHQRRNDRVSPRSRRAVLLPRDEHAAAGRAPGHRNGDRRRPRRVADSHRARRATDARSRGAADRRAGTPSSAASMPRIPTTASCRRPGRIVGLRVPQGPGVRDDSGAYEGGEVPIFYDPMISKLITWGDTRDTRSRGCGARSAEYEVRGIKTTIPFFQWVLRDEDFIAGRFDTGFIDRKLGARDGAPAARARREPAGTGGDRRSAVAHVARRRRRAGGGGQREPLEGSGAARCGRSDGARSRRRG